MRGLRGTLAASAALVVTALSLVAPATAAPRDDTAWLQAKLDGGGNVFLPKLPNGECYRTRGLWVSRDDTAISSDGACIVATGRGEARIKTGAGVPVHATAVFFLDHSDLFKPLPVRVSISGVRIVVPPKKNLQGVEMKGVSVAGHEVTLDHVTVTGAPKVDVDVGSGKAGSGGMVERIAIRDCVFSGGRKDVVSVFGPVDLVVERSTLTGARGNSAAGLHIGSADRGQPALQVRVVDNTIVGNAGPGIFLDLDPKNGAPVVASGLEISGNRVLRNARRAPLRQRGGIVLAGGQDDARGDLRLVGNAVHANGGPGLLGLHLRLVVTAEGNDLAGNRGGESRGLANAGPVTPSRGSAGTFPAPRFVNGLRDDTEWLQSRLDRSPGTIFLPQLQNGECYRTHGLWVSRDDTTITSDGACIVSLGPGEVRLHSIDGDPIAASGVFFVNRSDPRKPAPVRVSISNLRIVVPAGQEEMYGVAVFGHHVTLSGLDISGSPKDDVLIGARANGNGYVTRVAVLDSTLSGAMRNAISAFGVLGLQIERNTIQGVRDSPPGQPAAGIDVEPDERSQPTLGLRIADNTIVDNAGPGILLSLDSNSGFAVIATDLAIIGNRIERNSRRTTPPTLAGVAIVGGQDDGVGTLVLKDNIIKDNGGPGILTRALRLVLDASGNDLGGNRPGP